MTAEIKADGEVRLAASARLRDGDEYRHGLWGTSDLLATSIRVGYCPAWPDDGGV